MERLLEELIKESPTKERAKKSSEENLKQKIEELRIESIDEENEECKQKGEGNKEKEDNKETDI
jgi:predicted nucleic acid-binding protein